MPSPREMVPRLASMLPGRAIDAACPRHWNILKILQGLKLVLRSLRGDAVADSGLRVEPERRRSLKAAAQGNQQVAGHIPLRKTRLKRLGAIHVDVQLRLVEGLLDPQVRDSGDRAQLLHQIVRKQVIRIDVASHDLNINRGREAEV